jgi:predicted dinucleotide-binding enzyme
LKIIVCDDCVLVQVVKTLNTIGHNKYGSPTVGGEKADMFVAADNNDAKSEALNLVKEMGFNPVGEETNVFSC